MALLTSGFTKQKLFLKVRLLLPVIPKIYDFTHKALAVMCVILPLKNLKIDYRKKRYTIY